MRNFIPAFHFVSPDKKLKPEWCNDAIQYCYYGTNNVNLLEGKNIEEIQGYAAGDFSMKPFKRMFKSMAKKQEANAKNPAYRNVSENDIGFEPLPLIPVKLNSAAAIVQKIPIDVSVNALDPLAAKKKNEDVTFLKNKPMLEADLQDIADQMQIGKVDLGTTKHSSIPFSDSPYGLDLNEPDELEVFVDLLYNLAVEAAFETALEQFQFIKNGQQVKKMEIDDHYLYGVSSNMVFQSSITSLPDINYTYPGTISAPRSSLPDMSDHTHRFIDERMTVLEMYNAFSDEICDKSKLDDIINNSVYGYCKCNDIKYQDQNNFSSFKVSMVYCEIKTVDYVGVAPINKKSRFTTLVTDEDQMDNCSGKLWGQNTYGFWWLKGTKYFFGIERLPFAHRSKGQESFQNFSTNIYKSQKKSAVELSISENKKAQYADIKMQYEIIKALPPGKYIDLRYLRNALQGLTKEGSDYTQQNLIDLIMENNFFIGDTEGFEGKNDGQMKPFMDIPGGLNMQSIAGYLQVIASANNNIGRFTGINEQLTGQGTNPQGLVGMQDLLIKGSLNALDYVNAAVAAQEQKKFTIWANIIQHAIKEGGKAKEAIINLVGAKKVSLISALDEVPLHTLGVKVSVNQNQEFQQKFEQELVRLKQALVINTVDEYMLMEVVNKKDRWALLAVKYKQWEKKQERQRKEDMAQQQALLQQQGANQQQAVAAKTDGEIKKIYSQGDVSSKILELASQLGVQAEQLSFLNKKGLQQDRGQSQLDKSLKTMEAKKNLDNQQPFGE
jgi:hypothetical protein